MTTQLGLYNQALLLMGERRLTEIATSDKEQSQVELDTVWDEGAKDYCLEMGLWNFAMRSIQLTYNPSITPSFGYSYVFDHPSDFIRTASISIDEFHNEPLLDYVDESQYWLAEHDTLYIKYVSNDNSYGNDLSLWPQSYIKFVAAYLAMETCERITQSRVKKADLKDEYKTRLLDAKAKDAMAEPTKIPPSGNWVRARAGSVGRERGRRGQLIG